MGKEYAAITPELEAWIREQHLFFVATAPLAGDGMVNCSPKGLDSFRVVGPREVAYLDLTGSGIETVAHLRENGRIVLMFCAFAGPPKIVRLHGTGEVVLPGSLGWEALRPHFPDHPGARAIVRVAVARISDSCGFAVPTYTYQADRDILNRSNGSKSPEELAEYRRKKNTTSLDGLPGLPGIVPA
jgi:Pyridoxamine 5'-phosphate oxidase